MTLGHPAVETKCSTSRLSDKALLCMAMLATWISVHSLVRPMGIQKNGKQSCCLSHLRLEDGCHPLELARMLPQHTRQLLVRLPCTTQLTYSQSTLSGACPGQGPQAPCVCIHQSSWASSIHCCASRASRGGCQAYTAPPVTSRYEYARSCETSRSSAKAEGETSWAGAPAPATAPRHSSRRASNACGFSSAVRITLQQDCAKVSSCMYCALRASLLLRLRPQCFELCSGMHGHRQLLACVVEGKCC